MGRTRVNDVFTQEDWEYYNKYMESVQKDLAASDLPKEKQKEIFNTVGYQVQMRVAANRIGAEYNALVAEQNRLIDEYKKEPNDAKARKIGKKIEAMNPKIDVLEQESNFFTEKFHKITPKAVSLDNQLTEALVKKGYKIDARGRLRKSEGYRQSPTVKTRTHIKKSQTR